MPHAGHVVNVPEASHRENDTARQWSDADCAAFAGRGHAKPAQVEWWASRIGDIRVVDINADLSADLLDQYAAEPVLRYRGRNHDGKPVLDIVYRRGAAFGARGNSTVNRMTGTKDSMILIGRDHRLLQRAWRLRSRRACSEGRRPQIPVP